MSDHIELSVDCEVGEVRACRGCLAVRCKLYDIREKRLEQVFSDLTGLPVSGGFLCSVCLHLVYKFKAFREYCRNSGYILNHMFLINEDSLSSINRSNLRMPLSRSRMFHVHLESTRELQDKKEPLDLENDIKSEDSVEKVENFENLIKLENQHKIRNNIDNIRFDKVKMASLMDNDANELTDDYTNEIDFTDLTEKDDDVESNVDDDTNEPAPVRQKVEMCKYFINIWRAVSKENGDHYEMFDRLYKFSLIKERPELPRVIRKKEKKSEVYNFIKFLDLYKEIADIYKVDVEFISIIEERRAMDAKRKALAQDSDYCGMCCKKYNTAGTRDRHMKLVHNETLPFRCEVCLYTFKREGHFFMHLFKFHCTKKKCRECDQAIVPVAQRAQWTEVQFHIEMYHRRTLISCEFCGQTFTRSQSCFYHILHLHRGKINAVQCLLCGDSYNGTLGLRGHVHRIHTEAVKCATCAVFFKNKEAMAAHVAETGECRKDVSACPMCGATFSTESLMKQHYDDIHAESLMKQRYDDKHAKYKCKQKQKLRTSKLQTHTQEKAHECHICKKRFVNNRNRRTHVMTVHEGLPARKKKRPL